MVDDSRQRIASARQEVEMAILRARQRANPAEEKTELKTDSGRVVVYGPDAQRVLNEASTQLEERHAA